MVLLGSPAAFCSQFVSVQSEELTASFAATQHLLELGHKRIASLYRPVARHLGAGTLRGISRAHCEAGLDVDDALVFHAGSTIEDGNKAALQFANEQCNATAIQACNDLVAIGLRQHPPSAGHPHPARPVTRRFWQYSRSRAFPDSAHDHPSACSVSAVPPWMPCCNCSATNAQPAGGCQRSWSSGTAPPPASRINLPVGPDSRPCCWYALAKVGV